MARPILVSLLLATLLAALPAQAATEWVVCDPINVATFGSRVHVRCASSVGTGIFYFARETSNAADAQRFLATLLAAHVSGRPLTLLADLSNTSNLPAGCAAVDCRLLLAAAVTE
jgi:hypothetical protein